MSAISMPGTTAMNIGTSAFGTAYVSSYVSSYVASNAASLVTVDAQLVDHQGSATGARAAATASVPATESGRKWGRPPRGEPR